MTYSEIKITFNEEMPVNGIVRIQYTINTFPVTIFETWKLVRSAPKQVSIGIPTANVGEASAINFVNSFNLDYNVLGTFQVTRNINVVTIKSLNPQLEFLNGIAYKGKFIIDIGGGGRLINGVPKTTGSGTCTITHSGTFSAGATDTVKMTITNSGGYFVSVTANGSNYGSGTHTLTGTISYTTGQLPNTNNAHNATIRFENVTTGETSSTFNISAEVVENPC